MAPDGYLHGVLADGMRPFRYRSRVRTLLGLPDDTGVRVSFTPTAPGAGFTYVRYPRGAGEPYPPDEALLTAPRWLDHAADGLFDPPAPVATAAGRPPVAADTPAGRPPVAADTPAGWRDSAAGDTARRGELARVDQSPTVHPAPDPASALGPASAPDLAATSAPDSTVVIPGTTVRPERHRSNGGEPGSPDPRRGPERVEWSKPATGRLATGAAPPTSSGGQVRPGVSGGQARPEASSRPRQGTSAVGAVSSGELSPLTAAAPSPTGAGADHLPGAARPVVGRRPSTIQAWASAVPHPVVPGGRPEQPEPASAADWPVSEPAAGHRSLPFHRRAVFGPVAEGALRLVGPPYRPAAARRPAAPKTPPAQPGEVRAAPPRVVVVREPAPAMAGPAAFWERRHLSRLRARILR